MPVNDLKNRSSKAHNSKSKVTLSAKAKEVNQFKQHPEVRSERIKALKRGIDSGDYDIDSMKLAMKVLDEI